MYEKIESCPVCHSSEFEAYTICQDHSVTNESFAIMQCLNCSFLMTNPRPNESEILKYYESADYISHTNRASSLINLVYKIARFFTLRSKYKIVNRFAHRKNILDYGCGTGDFLNFVNKKNWNTVGLEPSLNARSIAKSRNLEIYKNLDEIEPLKKFSIVTLWHVLEHVHDLENTIKNIYSLISKKGHLIVAVPNHDSYDRRIYEENWAAYDVPRHLYHFNTLTISDLMKYHKLTLVETIPMKLDAYYISLLSEKYKSGGNRFIKAIINGWKSNSWAIKNKNNYSSLIYIFKKK